MFFPFSSILLVFTTQALFCFAAGDKGKEPIDLNYGPYHDYHQVSTSIPTDKAMHLHDSMKQGLNSIRSIHKLTSSQKEAFSFAKGYLKRKGMTLEEWFDFQVTNPDVSRDVWRAYRGRKANVQRIGRLRARLVKNSEDNQAIIEAENAGIDPLDLIKEGEYSNLPARRIKKKESKNSWGESRLKSGTSTWDLILEKGVFHGQICPKMTQLNQRSCQTSTISEKRFEGIRMIHN